MDTTQDANWAVEIVNLTPYEFEQIKELSTEDFMNKFMCIISDKRPREIILFNSGKLFLFQYDLIRKLNPTQLLLTDGTHG